VFGLAQIKDVYAELDKFKKRLKKGEPDIFEKDTGVLTAGIKKRKPKLSKE
jgi:hypothetical protein